jgi:hypothetical protein
MTALDFAAADQLREQRNSYTGILTLLDVVAQLCLSALAWLPLLSSALLAAETDRVPFRIALVTWQASSLCVTAIIKDGEPRYKFHARAFWPLMLSFGLGILLVPFNWGRTYFGLWLTLAQVLSIPYLLFSILALIRSFLTTNIRRRSASFSTLFRLRQIDFFTQTAILAGATLITIYHQRPLQESLLIAYPLLAAFQTLSSLSSLCFWREYAPWRSGIRIPHMVLQALLIIGTCARIFENGRFSWHSLLAEPAAQILIASYFLITFLEWELLDRTSLRIKPDAAFL